MASSRHRATNNSVSSLDEQSLLLAAVFKEKEKAKDKKSKDKKKKAATATLASLEMEKDSLSQLEEDEESLTWEQAKIQTEQLANPDYVDVSVYSEDQQSQFSDFQHSAEHSMSEDSGSEIAQTEEPVTEPVVVHSKPVLPREMAVLPELTSQGIGADLLKDHLTKVKEADKVADKISEPVAAGVDKFLRDSWYTSEMEKLSKQYPRIQNVKGLKVPKLDMEVFQLVQQNVRNTDQSFQSIQKALVSGMSALSPVLDLAIQRGNKDDELDPLTKNLLQGMQLFSFAFNAISTRRKEVLKPCLAPAYARVLTKGHDTTPEWLFGGDLLTTTKKCEAAKRIGEKVLNLKRKQDQQPPREIQQNKRFKGPQSSGQGMLRAHNPQNPQNVRFVQPQSYQYQFPNPQQMQQMQFPQQMGYQQQGFNPQGFQKNQRFTKPQNYPNQTGKKNNSYTK